MPGRQSPLPRLAGQRLVDHGAQGRPLTLGEQPVQQRLADQSPLRCAVEPLGGPVCVDDLTRDVHQQRGGVEGVEQAGLGRPAAPEFGRHRPIIAAWVCAHGTNLPERPVEGRTEAGLSRPRPRGSGRRPGAGSPRPSRLVVVTHSRPSGADDHGAQPAVRRRRTSPAAAPRAVGRDRHPPQPLPAQRTPSTAARRRRPARDGDASSRAPLHERVAIPGVAARALDLGPAVVAALVDQVELVPGVRRRTRRPTAGPRSSQRETLHVAVAQRPDRGAGQGLPGAGSPSGVIRRILPARRVAVLGELRVAGLAGGDVKRGRPGRTQPAAVVDEAVGDAGQHRLRAPSRPPSYFIRTTRLSCSVDT